MLLRVRQQRLRIHWRRRHAGFAGDKGQLRAAPRRFRAVCGDSKILRNRFAGINIAPVGQRLRPSGLQQVCLFQRAEVLAVNPQQVNGAVGLTPRGGFGLNTFYRVGGIRQRDNFKGNGIVRLHLTADPLQIAVDRRIAAPGVKPDGLAFSLLLNGLPAVGGK